MNGNREVSLNIGAGRTYIPGFTNIDISFNADLALDLDKEKLPFDDNSVDLVFSYHTLEHVQNYLFALSEIHRVLKHGGRFLIGLPYVTLTEYHLVNPYHLHNFNEFSFDFFDMRRLKGSAEEENTILFQKVFHRFHYIGVFNIVPPPLRSWCRRHLINVVRKIDFGLLAIKAKDEAIPEFDKRKLLRDFEDCLGKRIPYGHGATIENRGALRRCAKRVVSWWHGHG